MNGGGSHNPSTLVDKFEESFQNCLTAITKEDTLTNVDKDEIRVDVEECMNAFVESARAMEGYFLKKRLHIASQKPELLVRDDRNELQYELVRKDELLKKNYEKISYWQSILADLQSSTTVPKQGWNLGNMPPSTSTPSQLPGGHPTGLIGRPTPPSTLGRLTPGSGGPGSIGRMQSPSGMGFPSPMSQQGALGPLAFLEKAASTIGMPHDNINR